MDNILKVAIIIGIVIIGITGLYVFYRMKKIDKEDITEDNIEVDSRVNLDVLSNNEIKNEELDTDKKEIDNTSSIMIKQDIKEVDNSFNNIKESNTSNRLYANKYTSTSTLISPVGYYSGVVRNNLINKRASKQEGTNTIKEVVVNKNDITTTNNIDIANTNKKVSIDKRVSFADMKNIYTKKNKTSNYMEEITNRMAEEIKPQTITLTDYEQKQEDEAIISYQELLANRDKLFNISDEEEDENFIEALKSFRENLN